MAFLFDFLLLLGYIKGRNYLNKQYEFKRTNHG